MSIETNRLWNMITRHRSKSWTPKIILESTPGGVKPPVSYEPPMVAMDEAEHIMPVVQKMPLKRFAAAVERHTEIHGEPPELIWPVRNTK